MTGNARIVRVANNSRVERECPENFNGLSECWAAVVMTDVDPVNRNLVRYDECGLYDMAEV